MEAFIMGLATAFNILIIFRKIEKKRYQDAFFDGSLLVTLTLVFGGSLGGMLVATVASAIISLYFLWNPPKVLNSFIEQTTKDSKENTFDELVIDHTTDIDEILKHYNIKL